MWFIFLLNFELPGVKFKIMLKQFNSKIDTMLGLFILPQGKIASALEILLKRKQNIEVDDPIFLLT